MAKRELITREEAIKTVSRWIKADMTLGSSLFEMMMNEIPTITEQEIVKPYLDKIRAEIEKQEKWLLQAGYNTYNVDIAFNSIKLALAESEKV